MKKYLLPISAVGIYIVLQLISAIIGSVAVIFSTGASGIEAAQSPEFFSIVTIVVGIVATIIYAAMKLVKWKNLFRQDSTQPRNYLVPLVVGMAGVIALDVLFEELDIPDLLSDTFDTYMHNPLAMITIAVLGPIFEELCFREAALGGMLRRGVKPWTAILVSSLLFGIMHFNPIQVVGAGMMGIVLGILYYKSGNIILPCLLHIVNNSLSTVLTYFYGADCKMADLMGGRTIAISVAVAFAIIAVLYFVRYWRKTPSPIFFESKEDEEEAEEAINN